MYGQGSGASEAGVAQQLSGEKGVDTVPFAPWSDRVQVLQVVDVGLPPAAAAAGTVAVSTEAEGAGSPSPPSSSSDAMAATTAAAAGGAGALKRSGVQMEGLTDQAAATGSLGRAKGVLLGTIYLDWGGAYGCRVLKHARRGAPAATTSAAAAADRKAWVAEAVGEPVNPCASPVDSSGSRNEGEGSGCTSSSSSSSKAADGSAGDFPAVAIGLSQQLRQLSRNTSSSSSSSSTPSSECDSNDATMSSSKRTSSSNSSNTKSPSRTGSTDKAGTTAASSSSSNSSSCEGNPGYGTPGVLSPGLLWEVGHELGHAVHLVLAGR